MLHKVLAQYFRMRVPGGALDPGGPKKRPKRPKIYFLVHHFLELLNNHGFTTFWVKQVLFDHIVIFLKQNLYFEILIFEIKILQWNVLKTSPYIVYHKKTERDRGFWFETFDRWYYGLQNIKKGEKRHFWTCHANCTNLWRVTKSGLKNHDSVQKNV